MENKKITYTLSWTQSPEDWNVPGAIKLIEAVRRQIIDQQQKKFEEISIKETQALIERLRCKK